MPYIIETQTPARDRILGKQWHHVDHTAVATLDEARETILEDLRERGTCSECLGRTYRDEECNCEATDAEDVRDEFLFAQSMPESGGTVGPLPDGTVIEVRRASFQALNRDIGARGSRLWDEQDKRDILAAFNAA